MFCKLFCGKKSNHISTLAEGRLISPSCGSLGNSGRHGRYTRSVIDYEKGRVVYRKMEVERVRCGSCGHTHAILPDEIIPYSTYSLRFILRVLAAYYLGSKTVEELCRRYSISVSMLYEWKRLFLEHKEMWLGVLEDEGTDPSSFIRRLFTLTDYSTEFGKPFYIKTARSFLQRHRNAARFRHAVF